MRKLGREDAARRRSSKSERSRVARNPSSLRQLRQQRLHKGDDTMQLFLQPLGFLVLAKEPLGWETVDWLF
jgi:hypothetical protein